MSRDLTDKQVVDAFVAYRVGLDHPGIVVESRPDEYERTAAAIDAIAGPLAIEHTSIDTVAGQRRDGARFMDVVADLEQEIGRTLDYRLTITFPYEGVSSGQDWMKMRGGLKKWILEKSGFMQAGEHQLQLADLPFGIHVEKSDTAVRRSPGLFFRRYSPTEGDLAERIRVLINRKATKLGAHRAQGRVTVLVVESDDIALMNEEKLREAVSNAFPSGLPATIQELWYADTSVPGSPPEFSKF